MISVCVTHHLSILEPYLERALTSLANQKGVTYEATIISSCAISETLLAKFPQFKVLIDETLDTPTKKSNYWLDHIVGDAEHTLLLSNDVILSDQALVRMQAMPGEIIQTPLSNNENSHRFYASMPYPNNSYALDDVDENAVHTFNPPYSLMIKTSWISFYSPFMPTSVWKKVGRLNPAFDKKFNDTDFCLRAAELRIPVVINASCYALHYGSKTTKDYMSKSDEAAADKLFYETWPNHKMLTLLMN